jgi:hypothetical protein
MASIHKIKEEETIQCHLCPVWFTRTGSLKRHISSVHEGIKPPKVEKAHGFNSQSKGRVEMLP